MIKAVVFDLDDTLVPEEEYVKSGFRAIAVHFQEKSLYEKLYTLFLEDKKNVFQRMGFSTEKCSECIAVYRKHMPDITLPEESEAVLIDLKKKGYKTGIITDGRPQGQRNKIEALGLSKYMDQIIVTDELGGIEYRKPNPVPFELMKNQLGVEYEEMMYVGDNPHKDFYIGKIFPIYTVRIQKNTDIYKEIPYYQNVKEKKKIYKLKEIVSLI